MATSQITAAATSGRYMADFEKSVSPALKLMNVLTTATDASEMPIAAGMPSSLTRPDVCLMKRRPGSPLSAWAVPTSPLAICRPSFSEPPTRKEHEPPADLVTMLRFGQEIVNTYRHMAGKWRRDGPRNGPGPARALAPAASPGASLSGGPRCASWRARPTG